MSQNAEKVTAGSSYQINRIKTDFILAQGAVDYESELSKVNKSNTIYFFLRSSTSAVIY